MMVRAMSAAALAMTLANASFAADQDLSARIHNVETGLTNAVVVKGRSPVRRSIEDRMAFHHVPGVSLAIIDHGKVVWSKAYGVVTSGAAAPITTDTRFQAASISKTVAAATALSLVVEGKIDLDAPVNGMLKGWALPPSEIAPGYAPSVRALLSHSGGTSVHGFAGYVVGQPVPTLVQILNGVKPANSAPILIDHKPGVWEYSGGGTTIVQKVIEDVGGQPLSVMAQTRILGPVGMTLSTYKIPDQADQSFATGHRGDGTAIAGRWRVYPEQAAAGLWTTPGDLAKWAIAVAAAGRGDAGGGVDPRVAKLLLAPQPGLDTGGGAMGLGFFLNKAGATASLGHGGANEGFRCDLIYYTADGEGIAVMTDSDTGGALIGEIERAVATAFGWPSGAVREVTPVDADPAVLRRMAGALSIPAMVNAIVLKVEGGVLVATYYDGRVKPLIAIGPGEFINEEDGATITAAPNGDIVLKQASGGRLTLRKTS